MTDLHEIYATLIARGMPKHPSLRPAMPLGNCWRLDGLSSTVFLDWDEPVARDLLTMHALRWYYHDDRIPLPLNDPAAVARNQRMLSALLRGDVLEAILAATEHLNPKQA